MPLEWLPIRQISHSVVSRREIFLAQRRTFLQVSFSRLSGANRIGGTASCR